MNVNFSVNVRQYQPCDRLLPHTFLFLTVELIFLLSSIALIKMRSHNPPLSWDYSKDLLRRYSTGLYVVLVAVSRSGYIASNYRIINEFWIWIYVEESFSGLTEGTIPAFAWRGRGNTRKSSVSIAGLWAEIWTRSLPKTKQKHWPLGRNI